MRKVKLVFAALISVLPFNFLRVFAYRFLLGYKIGHAKIGFGTIIAVDEAEIGDSKIGAINLFVGPLKMCIGNSVYVGSANIFSCGYWTTRADHVDDDYARKLIIGDNTLISSQHYIDVAGEFSLGKGSWIAGYSSQFWTHGAGIPDHDIFIGENCYLASAVRFAPGTSVGDHTLVAMGSVVTKKFDQKKVMLGGVPAKLLKDDYSFEVKAPN